MGTDSKVYKAKKEEATRVMATSSLSIALTCRAPLPTAICRPEIKNYERRIRRNIAPAEPIKPVPSINSVLGSGTGVPVSDTA